MLLSAEIQKVQFGAGAREAGLERAKPHRELGQIREGVSGVLSCDSHNTSTAISHLPAEAAVENEASFWGGLGWFATRKCCACDYGQSRANWSKWADQPGA